MEASGDIHPRRGRKEMDNALCLINTDKWVPLLNRFFHLSVAQESQSSYPCIGARRPSPRAPNRLSSSAAKENRIEIGKWDPINDKMMKLPLQWMKFQIECTIGIALPSWKVLNGQLRLGPTTERQFRWRRLNSTIEDQCTKFKAKAYKLSPQSSMHTTHNPRSMLRNL